MLGFKSFERAVHIISGIKAMYIVKKGQSMKEMKSARNEKQFIDELFGLSS